MTVQTHSSSKQPLQQPLTLDNRITAPKVTTTRYPVPPAASTTTISEDNTTSSVSWDGGPPRPSPLHPSLKKAPPNQILQETMRRLRGRGIRLVAHGVECDAKRVWIRLNEKEEVIWQTEFPRSIPRNSGDSSSKIILMRGALHKIPCRDILYLDVGKRTAALMRTSSLLVPETVCFSLLTQKGSLDLQANSLLERDALVSCFSLVLDQVHEGKWRGMYEESSSVVTSSDGGGGSGYNSQEHDRYI